MKKTTKNFFKLTLILACGLTLGATVPFAMTSCSKPTKINYDEHNNYSEEFVVEGIDKAIECRFNQLISLIESQNGKNGKTIIDEDHMAQIKELEQQFVGVLSDIATQLKNTPKSEEKDPLEIFQDVLYLFNANGYLTNLIDKMCNSSIFQWLFDVEWSKEDNSCKPYMPTKLYDGFHPDDHHPEHHGRKVYDILKEQLFAVVDINQHYSLEKCAKANWNLENVFTLLSKRLGWSTEELWTTINGVYAPSYYNGINYDHSNGELIGSRHHIKEEVNHIYIDVDHVEEGSFDYAPLSYSAYDWSDVQPGDIMFSEGGFGVGDVTSGHCAIVEGWAVNDWGQKYVRVIEAGQFGVSYGIIDDNRIEKESLTIMRVNNSSAQQRQEAVWFAQDQLGKGYSIPIFLSEDVDHDASAWYCSELVWAAYENQGINVQLNSHYKADIPGIIPWEVYYYNSKTDLIVHK